MTTALAICCLVLVYMCVQANCATYMKLSNLATEYEIVKTWDQNIDNNLQLGTCKCNNDSCGCCISLFEKEEYAVKACINVANAAKDAILFTLTLNGRQLASKTISLKNPPSLCYNVPMSAGLAKVCVDVYNVNLAEKRMCARMSGIIDLKLKKIRVTKKIGCFKLPTSEDGMVTLLNEGNFLPIGELEPFIDDAEIESSDME